MESLGPAGFGSAYTTVYHRRVSTNPILLFGCLGLGLVFFLDLVSWIVEVLLFLFVFMHLF